MIILGNTARHDRYYLSIVASSFSANDVSNPLAPHFNNTYLFIYSDERARALQPGHGVHGRGRRGVRRALVPRRRAPQARFQVSFHVARDVSRGLKGKDKI